ncbi:putative core protein [Betaentomopoxvirus amoorei]|uniref:AMV148 n=1 Tax=Amsacta moorei entomopoxvirus TaxID=28321 RepID=Q9EMQ1_AMEPV|nr:putative core protein [Amsacta moorei entomopoxvirus]AAG02854.1 AMV148 [Amsacta moorei entomopoxvirus]
MPYFIVNNCFEFIDLKQGSIIIGYINILWNILNIIIFGITIDRINSYDFKHDELVILYNIVTIEIISSIISIFINILLLIGIYKRNTNFIKYYIIYSYVLTLIYILNLLFYLYYILYTGIVLFIAIILFNIYFLVIIRSYYYKLSETNSIINNVDI